MRLELQLLQQRGEGAKNSGFSASKAVDNHQRSGGDRDLARVKRVRRLIEVGNGRQLRDALRPRWAEQKLRRQLALIAGSQREVPDLETVALALRTEADSKRWQFDVKVLIGPKDSKFLKRKHE